MGSYRVAVLAGDGIGPEITEQALRVVEAACAATGVVLGWEHLDGGAGRFLATGTALPDEQYRACAEADAVFMGAIGLPEARHGDGREVAGDVIFGLRFGLDLYAGIRPTRSLPGVPGPLSGPGEVDYVVVRENVEGLYASRDGGTNVRGEVATDTLVVTRSGTERIVRLAFELARRRQRRSSRSRAKVTCVDKANVLSSYAFFRKVFDTVAAGFPDVESDHAYVDAMTARQVLRPGTLDVLVTENMFGDIISDLAAATVGGLGLAPSGDVGDRHAMFQPAHGSAPDIAGRGIANPTGAILSMAMMLDWLGRRHGDGAAGLAARLVEQATRRVAAEAGARTPDLGGTATTRSAAEAVVRAIEELAASETPGGQPIAG